MPYGAHETMEMHECLMDKLNAINHFNLYAQATSNPQLLDMIVRHQQEEIATYNEIVACTRGNSRFAPIPPNTNVRGVSNQQIQYGMNNPVQFAPQAGVSMGDAEIAMAMLLWHKSGARICTNAALECADPNVRRLMVNSAATCVNQAYEVFLLLNQQGVYPVPTSSQSANALLSSYQPASPSLAQQYGMPQQMTGGYGYNRMGGGYGAVSSTLPVGSQDSVLYGAGGGSDVLGQGGISMSSNAYTQGSMQ